MSALLGWAWALLVLAMGFHLVRAYGRLRFGDADVDAR